MDLKLSKQKTQQEEQKLMRETQQFNFWEKGDIPLEEQKRMEGERILGIQDFSLDTLEIYGVAKGARVKEMIPSRKGKCGKRQKHQYEKETAMNFPADEAKIRKLSSKRRDAFSRPMEEGIQRERESMIARGDALAVDAQTDAVQTAEARKFYGLYSDLAGKDPLDQNLFRDYHNKDAVVRKSVLEKITRELFRKNVTADWFQPEYLAKHSGEIYRMVEQFKYYRILMEDEANREYFDGLSEPERELIEERILKMADLYDAAFSFQCKSKGVNAQDGTQATEAGELLFTQTEIAGVNDFAKRIAERDQKTRTLVIRSYREECNATTSPKAYKEKKPSPELTEVLAYIKEHREAYYEYKPLVDMIENEMFRLWEASEVFQKDDIRRWGFKRHYYLGSKDHMDILGEQDKKQTAKALELVPERMAELKQAVIYVIDGKHLQKTKGAEDEKIRRLIQRYEREMNGLSEPVMKTIDGMTQEWKRLRIVENGIPKYGEKVYRKGMSISEYRSIYREQIDEEGVLSRRLEFAENINAEFKAGTVNNLSRVTNSRGSIDAFGVERMAANLQVLTVTTDTTREQAYSVLHKLAMGKPGESATEETDRAVEEGLREYKEILRKHLKMVEKKYGKLLTQLHPQDVLERINIREYTMDRFMNQETDAILKAKDMGIELFDMNDPEDQWFVNISDYYRNAMGAIDSYTMFGQQEESGTARGEILQGYIQALGDTMEEARNLENEIHDGPSLTVAQMGGYILQSRTRSQKEKSQVAKNSYHRW